MFLCTERVHFQTLWTESFSFSLFHNVFSASEDSSRIYVAVGFGFFVEMTHDEALRFIEKKTSQLTASVQQHQQRRLAHVFLRFYVCIFIYTYIKRCNPNMVAVCVSVSRSSSPKTQRRLKQTYAWCWRSVQSFFSSLESLDHLCCLPVTLSALLVQCWTLE